MREINEALEVSMAESKEIVNSFDWENPRMYEWWLSQTYYMVRHTTRYLCKLGGSFDFDREEFHKMAIKHLREETGHEVMAQKDLERMGSSLDNHHELEPTHKSLQEQYEWFVKCPVAHLGFVVYLESLSIHVGNIIMERAEKAHGNKTISFIDHHVDADMEHVNILLSTIEKTTKEEKANVLENIIHSKDFYCKMLSEIMNIGSVKAVA